MVSALPFRGRGGGSVFESPWRCLLLKTLEYWFEALTTAWFRYLTACSILQESLLHSCK